MLMFLHLSDIHFHKWSGSAYDFNADLRNELEIDAEAFAKSTVTPNGILITGDIAFSGQREEFAIAKAWLRTLCDKVGCTLAEVWCIPGNHDVDQRMAKESATLADIQQTLRDVATNNPLQLDGEILKRMADPLAGQPLYQPIGEYNSFAATFECGIDSSNPKWEYKFPLDDGSELRLNGLNSTIVSNHLDNHQRFVVMGRHQIPSRSAGVVDFVMCHHPHDWLRGDDTVKVTMNERIPVQLFGHKHVQALDLINGALHIVAGAVHPDRSESSWLPRYNWLKVQVQKEDQTRQLVVTVYPRVWTARGRFAPDFNSCNGEEHRVFPFVLPSWTPPPPPAEVITKTTVPPPPALAKGSVMKRPRILTYRFFDLSHVERIDIARELNLLRDDDEGVTDAELYKRIFHRATESDVLSDLWSKVGEKHKDTERTEQPHSL